MNEISWVETMALGWGQPHVNGYPTLLIAMRDGGSVAYQISDPSGRIWNPDFDMKSPNY